MGKKRGSEPVVPLKRQENRITVEAPRKSRRRDIVINRVRMVIPNKRIYKRRPKHQGRKEDSSTRFSKGAFLLFQRIRYHGLAE